jgi:drug/metabolite transporter (DMT)-like permease
MTDTEPESPQESPAPTTPPVRDEDGPGMSTMAIGLVLVLIGAALFAGQLFDVGIDDIGWPFFVIAAGVAVLVIGLLVANEQGMVIGGTITTTVGLVLLYQNNTGRWESWAYAWALVGPAASGLGLALWGIRSQNSEDVRNGTWGLLGGLAVFVIGFLFFEGVIGIGGDRLSLPEWLLPAAVIAIGVVVLGRGLLERRSPETG